MKNEPSNALSTADFCSTFALFEGFENRLQKHVAFDGSAGFEDARADRLGKLGEVLLEADAAAEVLVEHDVKAFAQVLPDHGDVLDGHPREVGFDDPFLKRYVGRPVEPLPERAKGLKPGPEVGVVGQPDQPVGEVDPRVHAVELVREDPRGAAPDAGVGGVECGFDRVETDAAIAESAERMGRRAPDDLGRIDQPLCQRLDGFRAPESSQAGRGRGADQRRRMIEEPDDRGRKGGPVGFGVRPTGFPGRQVCG